MHLVVKCICFCESFRLLSQCCCETVKCCFPSLSF